MATQRKRQSLATALRLVRSVIRKAEETDFTTRREDTALNTVFAAVTVMYNFLQELARSTSLCNCTERSWFGPDHDSQCNVTQIRHLLQEVGRVSRTGYYVLFIDGDVEPYLHGPYKTEQERDNMAKKFRREDSQSPKSGLYRLTCNPTPTVDAYSGGFFED